MNKLSPPQNLLHLLDQEVEQASFLLEALNEEHTALNERQSDRIEAAVKAKQERLANFERCEQQRKRWLQQAGVAEQAGEIRDFLRKQESQPEELVALWDRLIATAGQCREQNRVNGALVEIHRRHVQRALDILRGTQETPTYGPYGETRSGDDTHSLAKA